MTDESDFIDPAELGHWAKTYEGKWRGSMVGAPALAFALWDYILCHTNYKKGVVELNPVILSALIGGTAREDIEMQIEMFCSPDPRSRTKEHEGRKLLRIGEWSYQVVNWRKYQPMGKTPEERLEQSSLGMRRLRAMRKAEQQPPPPAPVGPSAPPPAESPEPIMEKISRKRSKRVSPAYTTEFEMWWSAFRKGHPLSPSDKAEAFGVWQTTDNKPPVEEMIRIWERQKRTIFWNAREGKVFGVRIGQGYLSHRDWEREYIKDDPQPDSFPVEGLPMFSNSRTAALAAQGKVEDGQGREGEDARGTQGRDGKDWQGAGEAGKPGLEPWRSDALSPDDEDIPFA